jgi:hypothetical protein
MYMHVKAWTYDVWGNEEGGYTVNDRSMIADDIYMDTDMWYGRTARDEKKLMRFIKKIFGLNKNIRDKSLALTGDDFVIYVDYESRAGLIPIGELDVIEIIPDKNKEEVR